MRRLILECTVGELGSYMGVSSELEKLEFFEVLNLLKDEPKEWAMICRVKMRDSKESFERVLKDESAIIQLLESEKDGSRIYFLKRRPNPLATGLIATGGFLSVPLEIRAGRLRASFLGNSIEIKKFLKLIRREKIHFRVASNTDARFSPVSPLGSLTEKQRRVIISAFSLGYYEIPKRISSEELARKLRIREATFVRHRIKAERRLLAAILSDT